MIIFAFVYGILTIAGGVMGYVQAGSTISLLAGGIAGLLIVAFAALYKKGNVAGFYGLLVVSLGLGGFFLSRYLESGKVMPALVMTALSGLNLVGFLLFARPAKTPQPQV